MIREPDPSIFYAPGHAGPQPPAGDPDQPLAVLEPLPARRLRRPTLLRRWVALGSRLLGRSGRRLLGLHRPVGGGAHNEEGPGTSAESPVATLRPPPDRPGVEGSSKRDEEGAG